jgi:hypothetical protein
MKELTKRETRREYLRDEHWLKMHGNQASPKWAARNIRKHLRMR